jgi:hypothetical protein
MGFSKVHTNTHTRPYGRFLQSVYVTLVSIRIRGVEFAGLGGARDQHVADPSQNRKNTFHKSPPHLPKGWAYANGVATPSLAPRWAIRPRPLFRGPGRNHRFLLRLPTIW